MKFRFLVACAFFGATALRLRTVVVCNKKVPRMHQENAFGAAYHWIIKRFPALSCPIRVAS